VNPYRKRVGGSGCSVRRYGPRGVVMIPVVQARSGAVLQGPDRPEAAAAEKNDREPPSEAA
jgi:hypothetical protein